MTHFVLTDVAGLHAWTGKGFVDLTVWEDHALTYGTRDAAEAAMKTQRRRGIHLVVRSADEVTAAVSEFRRRTWVAR